MRSAGFFIFGVAVGAVATVLVNRIREVIDNDNVDHVVDQLSRQVQLLDRRFGSDSA
jgi:hypothetical protein